MAKIFQQIPIKSGEQLYISGIDNHKESRSMIINYFSSHNLKDEGTGVLCEIDGNSDLIGILVGDRIRYSFSVDYIQNFIKVTNK